jgi:hypothetical protein
MAQSKNSKKLMDDGPTHEEALAEYVTIAAIEDAVCNYLDDMDANEVAQLIIEHLTAEQKKGLAKQLAETHIETKELDTLQPKEIAWLWPSRIALGKFTCIDGDPDLGKSTVALDLAARVSTKGIMPDDSQGATGNVAIMSEEDDLQDTILPRLLAAGADPSKIILIDEIGGVPPMFSAHCDAIEKILTQRQIKLLIADNIILALGLERLTTPTVRPVMSRIKKMAERTQCAILGIRHLNKSSGGSKAIYRGEQTIAITAAARTGYLIAEDPDDAQCRIFACHKMNLAEKPKALRYRLQPDPVYNVASVAWDTKPCDYKADDLLIEDGLLSPEREQIIAKILEAGELQSPTMLAQLLSKPMNTVNQLCHQMKKSGLLYAPTKKGHWWPKDEPYPPKSKTDSQNNHNPANPANPPAFAD